MAENRKVNDRNLVIFGIPDVPVERELSYINDELTRREVVQDAPRVKTQAPTPTAVTPTPAPFVINGLTTSPPIVNQGWVFNQDGEQSSFAVDTDNELGAGSGALWFLIRRGDGGGSFSTQPGGTLDYQVASHNPTTNTTIIQSPIQTVFPGGFSGTSTTSTDKTLYIADGKLFAGDYIEVSQGFELYDSSLPYMGVSTTPAFGSTYSTPLTSLIPIASISGHTSMVVSGTTYLVGIGSGAGGGQYAYNTETNTWSGQILGPDGVNPPSRMVCKGSYMWCSYGGDLYSATASLTPTWNFRNTDEVSFEMSSNWADIMPNTGELVVAWNFATFPGFRRGIRSYNFTTGARTDRTGIFSATGLPSTSRQFSGTADVEPSLNNFYVTAGDNCVVFSGIIRSDALGTTVYESSSSPTNKLWVAAAWVLTGSGSSLGTSATRIAEIDVSAWPSPNPLATNWQNLTYGGAETVGSKVYTWLGGFVTQSNQSGIPYIDYTAQVESWIREHQI
jgi:hypothetical protein